VPRDVTLIELGSGNSAKTRILIRQLIHRHSGRPSVRNGALRYVPVDISRTMLEESAHALLGDFPELRVTAIAGEYNDSLRHLRSRDGRVKLILWLGSNVGNLHRHEAARFLRRIRSIMLPLDRFLIGVDLRKSPQVLVRAYDDSAGVTAQFNKNILSRINRELG